MAKKSFAEALKAVNQSLKQERTGVTLQQRGRSLFARGTFPPKPGSTKVAPHQQEIALKVGADHAGLAWANVKCQLRRPIDCINFLLLFTTKVNFNWKASDRISFKRQVSIATVKNDNKNGCTTGMDCDWTQSE